MRFIIKSLFLLISFAFISNAAPSIPTPSAPAPTPAAPAPVTSLPIQQQSVPIQPVQAPNTAAPNIVPSATPTPAPSQPVVFPTVAQPQTLATQPISIAQQTAPVQAQGTSAEVFAPAPVVQQGPDLILDGRPEVLQADIVYRFFPAFDCAVIEGCAKAGWRKLLRFNSNIYNGGTTDLVLGDPRNQVNQRYFEWSSCHGHFHRGDVLEISLLTQQGQQVTKGAKIGVCMEDTVAYDSNLPPKYDCYNQGIQAKYADVYTKDLDCQWIDITEVQSGTYHLAMEINANRRIPEMNYDNNRAVVQVQF